MTPFGVRDPDLDQFISIVRTGKGFVSPTILAEMLDGPEAVATSYGSWLQPALHWWTLGTLAQTKRLHLDGRNVWLSNQRS